MDMAREIGRRALFPLMAALAWACGLAWGADTSSQQVYSIGNPSSLAQYTLQLINRARSDPLAEGQRLGIDVTADLPATATGQVGPMPPLAFNALLLSAAEEHTQDMSTQHYFSQTDLVGRLPSNRIAAAGYTDTTGTGENIAMLADSGQTATAAAGTMYVNLMKAASDPNGNRMNLLGIGDPASQSAEIGIGFVDLGADVLLKDDQTKVRFFETEDFGARSNNTVFIVGVVYADLNGNGFYDPGEGLGSVDVIPSTGQYRAVTAASGGFALPMPAGTVTLTVSGGSFAGTATQTVMVGQNSIEVDFISGQAVGLVNFGHGGGSGSSGGSGTTTEAVVVTDTDNDGYPDDLEAYFGSDPANAASLPPIGVNPTTVGLIRNLRLESRLHFAAGKESTDSISFRGEQVLPAMRMAGRTVVVYVNGYITALTLNDDGRGRKPNGDQPGDYIAVRRSPRTGLVRFWVRLANQNFKTLLLGATTPDQFVDVGHDWRPVTILVLFTGATTGQPLGVKQTVYYKRRGNLVIGRPTVEYSPLPPL